MAIQYICNNPQRKTRIRDTVNDLNGIDYLEVFDPPEADSNLRQRKLFVHFIKPENLETLVTANIRIEGGSRIKGIKVTALTVVSAEPEVLVVDVDRYGDFSLYQLRIVKGAGDLSSPDWLDPILSFVEFSFKVACPSDFDCRQQVECPPEALAEPEIDYLAKDYASFRQLMLDRLATIIPAWRERNPSDVGMAAVEILAYAGDHLSYYQDGVATEAYLGTARRRVSMRRHARLLDYPMHEGSNARTWVLLNASENAEAYVVPAHIPLLTRGPRPDVTELDLSSQSGFDVVSSVTVKDFALFASESVLIEALSKIHEGHVGANQATTTIIQGDSDEDDEDEGQEQQSGLVTVESNVNFSDEDSIIFADKVIIEDDAQVANVAYHNELVNEGIITGKTYQIASFPLLDQLPVVPDFSPGSTDIEVEENETQTLAQGDYAELEVEHGARVTFSGGTYNFKSWELERNVRLYFTAATEIRIAEKLVTKNYVRINHGAENQTVSSNDVIIYVKGHGEDDDDEHNDTLVKFGYRNQINANVYAPDLNMDFRDSVHARGTFFARRIATGRRAQFHHDKVKVVNSLCRNLRLCVENLNEGMHVFETMHPITLHHHHNFIEFYTWGDDECCLPAGSTKASLNNEGNRLANLQAGDLLLFEEILGTNGRPEDADLSHHHVVRVSKAENSEDPLYEEQSSYMEAGVEKTALRVLNIEWALEDALPFPLCLNKVVPSDMMGDEELVSELEQGIATSISVARGNVVLADHGRTICEESLQPAIVPAFGQRYRPRLRRAELTFRVPYQDEAARTEAATGLLTQDPRKGIPDIHLRASNSEAWTPRQDLLNSGRFAPEFVTETEDDGRAYLRFGDNILGKQPAPGLIFSATYRVGIGVAGNIGAKTLKQIILPEEDRNLEREIRVHNPFPAMGGTDPEEIEQVRLYAPQAFRTQKRAVTPSDYAQMAEGHSEVQKAVAMQRWTGSWHSVFITIDRKGGREVDAEFEKEISDYLEPLRMMGHDIEVEAPRLVALDVAIRICVRPEYLKSKVKEELLEVFSNSELSDGRRGFFHPDNFTFGQSVYLSRVVAAAMQVPGVSWVDPLRFQRWGQPEQSNTQKEQPMLLAMGRLEIARLDNDPNAPENGRLEFVMEGGL